MMGRSHLCRGLSGSISYRSIDSVRRNALQWMGWVCARLVTTGALLELLQDHRVRNQALGYGHMGPGRDTYALKWSHSRHLTVGGLLSDHVGVGGQPQVEGEDEVARDVRLQKALHQLVACAQGLRRTSCTRTRTQANITIPAPTLELCSSDKVNASPLEALPSGASISAGESPCVKQCPNE